MPTSGACPVSSGRASSCDSVSTSPSNGSRDRKSTRLNSSHITNSYAVFCSKKKRKDVDDDRQRGAVSDGAIESQHIGRLHLCLVVMRRTHHCNVVSQLGCVLGDAHRLNRLL